MRTVTYKSVIDRIASYMGESDGLHAEDAIIANSLVNIFGRLGWEFFFWPELMLTERRTFRAEYSSLTAYAAPSLTVASEVYFPAADAYYQALKATTGNAPATLSGSSYVVNSAYWAECASSYGGADWADLTVYAVAAQVRNPSNGRWYQCHTAHTSSGSLDVTKFGLLTDFVRSIAYEQSGETAIGEVKAIWDRNPDASPASARRMVKSNRSSYVRVGGYANVVWVEFRRRPNVWTGAVRSDAVGYASGNVRYDTVTGDYWTANGIVAAGESPTTNPELWEVVEFPYVLGEFVALSAYSVMSVGDGAGTYTAAPPASAVMAAGWPLLQAELEKIERQEGQTRQLRVVR